MTNNIRRHWVPGFFYPSDDYTVVGLFRFPPVVNSFSSLIIQSVHSSRIFVLNGLFMDTSSGCKTEVQPPGITAWVTFIDFRVLFTLSPRCPRNMSHTSRLFLLIRAPGRVDHTFSSHTLHRSSFIHPFSFTCTNTPAGSFSLGIVFLLNTTIGFNFVPSAMHNLTQLSCMISLLPLFSRTLSFHL